MYGGVIGSSNKKAEQSGGSSNIPTDWVEYYLLDTDGYSATGTRDLIQEGNIDWSGTGALFDGSMVLYNENDILDIRTDSITISVWITTSDISNYRYFTAKSVRAGADNRYYAGISDEGKFRFAIVTDTYYNAIGTETATLNEWYLVVVMYDHNENKVKLNINTVEQASIDIDPYGDFDSIFAFQIGAYNSTSRTQTNHDTYGGWKGRIHKYRRYNRILTQDEIQAIYDEEIGEHS